MEVSIFNRLFSFIMLYLFCWPALAAIPVFTDVTLSANINHTVSSSAQADEGGGTAWIDIDNDGYQDLYVLNSTSGANWLYHNIDDGNGNRIFEEIAQLPGSAAHNRGFQSRGVAIGDYNGDGCDDIFIATANNSVFTPQNVDTTPSSRNTLLRNNFCINGSLTFTDATIAVNLYQEQERSWVAAFGDIDLDGDLDLYVGNWNANSSACTEDRLYINNNGTSFTESAAALGINATGCTLGVVFTDFDDDGDLDIITANDFSPVNNIPDSIYKNFFKEGAVGFLNVVGATNFSDAAFGMGIAVGDYDNDGALDYYSTSMGINESAVLNHNNTAAGFQDATIAAKVADPSSGIPGFSGNLTGWGSVFFDADNDGWLDIYKANGFITIFFDALEPEHNSLFHNQRNGTFTEISAAAGVGGLLSATICEQLFRDVGYVGPCFTQSRGVAAADYDNDGDEDLFVVNTGNWRLNDFLSAQRPYLFRSEAQANGNFWTEIRLKGNLPNHRGIGAKVKVTTPDGITQMREIHAGSSHGSTSSSVAAFGLGNNISVTNVTVEWPGGCVQDATALVSINHINTVPESVCGITTFSGTIRNIANGQVIEGVDVTAINLLALTAYNTRTDVFGNFVLPAEPVGNYLVSYTKEGFDVVQRTVSVSGASVSLNWFLSGTPTFTATFNVVDSVTGLGVPNAFLDIRELSVPNRNIYGWTNAAGQFTAHLPVSGHLFFSLGLHVNYLMPTPGSVSPTSLSATINAIPLL